MGIIPHNSVQGIVIKRESCNDKNKRAWTKLSIRSHDVM